MLLAVDEKLQADWRLENQDFDTKVAEVLGEDQAMTNYDYEKLKKPIHPRETERFIHTASTFTVYIEPKLESDYQLMPSDMHTAFEKSLS